MAGVSGEDPSRSADNNPDMELADPEEVSRLDQAPFTEHMVRHIHASKAWLFASILLTLFLALVVSISTESGTLLAMIGFLPTILAAIIFIALLEGNYKDVLFWLVPLAIGFLFFAVGPFLNPLLRNQLDIPVLTAINLLLSYLILAVMLLIEYRMESDATLEETESFKPEELEKYVHTIEDKCKALNFVIGRVYRASNGGTKELREKIKISPELYNEFNSIKPEEVKEKREDAIGLLIAIKDRLTNLLSLEKAIFTPGEVKGLKHLARDPDGKDRILDVLTVNDQDPVEDYFLGAIDFCKRIITELEKL